MEGGKELNICHESDRSCLESKLRTQPTLRIILIREIQGVDQLANRAFDAVERCFGFERANERMPE
jgi:hypothetical protein